MRKRGIDRVTLRVIFPDNFPNAPPFVHMLRPRLREGTGYVLGGGGICMEMLTPQQWSPATSINALIQSVRAMLDMGKAALRTTAPGAKECAVATAPASATAATTTTACAAAAAAHSMPHTSPSRAQRKEYRRRRAPPTARPMRAQG